MKVNARSLLAGLTLAAACYSEKGTAYAIPLPQPAVEMPTSSVAQLPRSTEAEERDEQLLALRDYVENVQELGGSAFKRALMRKRTVKAPSSSLGSTSDGHVKRDPEPSLQNININISGPGECADGNTDGCDGKKEDKKHDCHKKCKEGCQCECCKDKSDKNGPDDLSNEDVSGLIGGPKSSLGPLGSNGLDDGLYDDDLAMDPYSGMNGSKGPHPIPPKDSSDALGGPMDDGLYGDGMAMDPYSGMNGSKGPSSKPLGPDSMDPSLDPYGMDDGMGPDPSGSLGSGGLGGGPIGNSAGGPPKMPSSLGGPDGAYDPSYDLGPDPYGMDDGMPGGAASGLGGGMASSKGPRSTPPGMDPYDDLYPYDLPSDVPSGPPSGPSSHPSSSSKTPPPFDDPYGYDPTLDGPMGYDDSMLDGPMSGPSALGSGPSKGGPLGPIGTSTLQPPPGVDGANSTKIVFKPLDDPNASASSGGPPNRAISSGGMGPGMMEDLNGDGIYDDLPPYPSSGPSGLGNIPSAPPLPPTNKNYFIYPITDSSKTITLNKGDMVAYVDKQGNVAMSGGDMSAAADEMLGGGLASMYDDDLPPLSGPTSGHPSLSGPPHGNSSGLKASSGPPSDPGFSLDDLYGGPPPPPSASHAPPPGLPSQLNMPPKHLPSSTGPPPPTTPPMMKRSHPRMFEMEKRSTKKNKEVAVFAKRGEQASIKREI